MYFSSSKGPWKKIYGLTPPKKVKRIAIHRFIWLACSFGQSVAPLNFCITLQTFILGTTCAWVTEGLSNVSGLEVGGVCSGVFSPKDYYNLLLPHYLSGWIFIATSLKPSGLQFTFFCWLMQLFPCSLLCFAYHFRAILFRSQCVCGKFSGMLLGHMGNNGRLAIPIAEFNNRFRN